MMSNILRLRWINMVGGIIFTFYGYLIGAIPVFVLNGMIVLIDIYYIVEIYRAQDTFSLMETKPADWFLYISPSYRDYKNAYYLITTRKQKFSLEGIRHLETESSIIRHQRYLKKIGFKQNVKQPTKFNKSL
jgi:hypothetical protein